MFCALLRNKKHPLCKTEGKDIGKYYLRLQESPLLKKWFPNDPSDRFPGNWVKDRNTSF